MDIGIPVPNITPPATPEAIHRVPQAAEQLGFHSVWLGDHIVRPIGPDQPAYFKESSRYTWDLYEPMVSAGFVAANTTTVKIGFGVLVLPYRNPVVTAKAVASLDQLSNGRVILGVGSGYWPQEFQALNMPQRHAGLRTEEYIELFRSLWKSEKPEFHGEFVEISDVLFKPSPQQDDLPIWLGGMSDSAIRRAVRIADGWHVPRFTVSGMAYQMRRLREVAAAEKRDLSRFVVSNRPEVRFARKASKPDLAQDFRSGDPAPVASPIVGPPEYVAERLAAFGELGVSHLVIDLHEGGTLKEVLGAMETFAESVMPHLTTSSTASLDS